MLDPGVLIRQQQQQTSRAFERQPARALEYILERTTNTKRISRGTLREESGGRRRQSPLRAATPASRDGPTEPCSDKQLRRP